MVHGFYGILQGGFFVKCRAGTSVRLFLCEDLGLNPRYVDERITTIFIDGSCVDNIDRASLWEGSTLALSSAMPGLAGATLRRKSIYASMRSSITYAEDINKHQEDDVLIKIKIFNLLIDELGPIFLQRGIFLRESEVIDLLKDKNETFWNMCSEMIVDGTIVDRKFLLHAQEPSRSDFVHFIVRFNVEQ